MAFFTTVFTTVLASNGPLVASSAGGYALGSGRLVPTAAAAVALLSVVVGRSALGRRGRPRHGDGRSAAVVAVVLGLAGAVVGGLHLASSAGGLGTGNGFAAAVLAVPLGVAGFALGAVGTVRSRGTAGPRRRVDR